MSELRIEPWKGPAGQDLPMLADVLHACVHGGASVSFVLPFSLEDAGRFWLHKVLPAMEAGTRRVLVARRGGRIVGTVQADFGTPPNQAHRADVLKLLVHPEARRLGIARKLMIEIEQVIRAEGRTLVTLDTLTGDAAEPLYLSLGYVLAGVIPGYSRDPFSSRLDSASFLYKQL